MVFRLKACKSLWNSARCSVYTSVSKKNKKHTQKEKKKKKKERKKRKRKKDKLYQCV